MIPVYCICHIVDSVKSVMCIHHVFVVGMLNVPTKMYYDIIEGINEEYVHKCMADCHIVALMTLRKVLNRYGMNVEENI